jgi:dehydrogenase/reductase SDR family protein 4
MAGCGARVVVSSRSREDCEAAATQLETRYGSGCAIGVACDVSRPDQIDNLVASAAERWGRLDCVVAHASTTMDTTSWIERVDEGHLAAALASNVIAATRLVKRAVPIMREIGGGAVIITSSVAGIVPMEDRLTYGLTKAALIHLTKILAVQLGPLNIRVNSVAPGIIDSAADGQGIWADAELREAAVGPIPLGRTGTPDEIAGCVVWLASPSGAFTTGQVLIVDGGQMSKGTQGVRSMHDIVRARRRNP